MAQNTGLEYVPRPHCCLRAGMRMGAASNSGTRHLAIIYASIDYRSLKKFTAHVQHDGKRIDLGTCDTLEEAVDARCAFDFEHVGVYCRHEAPRSRSASHPAACACTPPLDGCLTVPMHRGPSVAAWTAVRDDPR